MPCNLETWNMLHHLRGLYTCKDFHEQVTLKFYVGLMQIWDYLCKIASKSLVHHKIESFRIYDCQKKVVINVGHLSFFNYGYIIFRIIVQILLQIRSYAIPFYLVTKSSSFTLNRLNITFDPSYNYILILTKTMVV